MMHSEISKFWSQMGAVGVTHLNDSECYYLVGPKGDITSNVGRWITVAREFNGEIIEYYFQNKTISEKDMLRIIKLKAFI